MTPLTSMQSTTPPVAASAGAASAGAATARTSRATLALLALILLLGGALRTLDIAWHPFAPDEEFTMRLVRLPWRGLVTATMLDTHPPLHYLLAKLWCAITAPTYDQARFLSVLFSIAGLALTFALARRLFGLPAAFAATLCAAIAPYQVYWGHVARNHQLLPPLAGAIVLLSYRHVERPDGRTWLALSLAWLLALQTNYMALVFLVPWSMAFLLAERPARAAQLQLALAPVPGLVALLPWLGILADQIVTGPMNRPRFQEVVSPMYFYYHAIFGDMEPFARHKEGGQFLAELLAFAVVFAAGIRVVGRRWSVWILLLGMTIVPIVVAWKARWSLAERHLLFALPVFNAYWGAGLMALSQGIARRVRGAPPGVRPGAATPIAN